MPSRAKTSVCTSTAKFTREDNHHDGTNHYLFRKVRAGRNVDALYEKIMNEEIGFKDARVIGTYTSPIKEVKDIFGW